MKAKIEARREAIRLRVEERQSLTEIQRQLGVSKGSLSQWLQPYPLDADELQQRRRANATRTAEARRLKAGSGEPSAWYKVAAAGPLSSEQKGMIAEAAVLFRLTLHGFTPLRPVFEGNKADWLVPVEGRTVKLQVKWTRRTGQGQPFVQARRSTRHGWRLYDQSDFDFLVGYDLFLDTAFVYSWEDLRGRGQTSVQPEFAEAWDKLRVVA